MPAPRQEGAGLDPEATLHAVVGYLLAKGFKEVVRHLAMAHVVFRISRRDVLGFDRVNVSVTIAGSPSTFDYFGRFLDRSSDSLDDSHALSALMTAFEYALPGGVEFDGIERRLLVTDVADGWREDIVRELNEHTGHNQGVARPGDEIITWRNLRFRSLSEMKIAEALDRAGVLFLPNCRARLGQQKRGNLEPDFLVCHNGVWGILEVDGEPFHPPTRTVHDHERDRPFLRHGVKLVQHFDATRCRNDPDGVVAEFLALLER